jgi:hypothetical protein
MVEPTYAVWLDQISRDLMLRVPSRITMDQLLQQIGQELRVNLGNAVHWQLWKGDQVAAPPLVDGEIYGLVPRVIQVRANLEPVKKRDIEFTSEIRKYGQLVAVTAELAKVQHKAKVPPEITPPQLVRTHVAISSLPPDSLLSWGKITGRGIPGKLQEGDVVEIKVGNQEISKCYVYTGWGKFAEPFEMDISAREEPEVLAEANRLNPAIGMNPQYYQGLEKLPRLMPVRELLIFPGDIERSSMDSSTLTGLTADRMRTVGPMKRIRWIVTGSKGKEISQIQEATIPEDVLLIQFWMEVIKAKIPAIESTEVAWGRQFRNGHEIGHGPPITFQDGDLIHIEIKEQKKLVVKGTKSRIEYSIGTKAAVIMAREDQKAGDIKGQKIIVVVSPLVEVILLYRGIERTSVAASTWSQEQFTNGAKAAVNGRGDKFLARRVGAEEEPWEIRAGHTYELVETGNLTIKLYQKTKKLFEIKIAGTASIGDVAERVSSHMKLPPWEHITIKRMDGKTFWLENGGKYQVEQSYDEEGDTRPRLKIIIITFTWSGPRGVAGYTEAHACAWHVCQLSLSDP